MNFRSLFSNSPSTAPGNGPKAPPQARICIWADSHVGRVRTVNEDSVYFTQPENAVQSDGRGVLAMVADGMGGSQGGAVASQIASSRIPALYFDSGVAAPKALRRAMQAANSEIYERAKQEAHLAGMGTTCVALALNPEIAWVAWVGDSRLYLIRDGKIFQMTEDHSVVQEMVRRGLLTASQAVAHEERNLVTRALGSHRKVEVAVWDQPFPVRIGDRFLLCTDGLHDLLPDADVLDIAGSAAIDVSCSALIAEANRRGGHDNISVVLVEVTDRTVDDSPVAATRQSPVAAEVKV
jgi:protein phosphatase